MRRLFCLMLLCSFAAPAGACGPDTDCVIGDRTYRISLPEGYDAGRPVGAIVFSHGYRGSAAGVMRNMSLRRVASNLGVALIAANSAGAGWNIPSAPRNIDSDGAEEFAYFDALLRDSQRRFAIDGSRVLATGFSAGGMVTWNLACHMSDRFAAFAPMSGTYWKGPPDTCARPVTSILHMHGDKDRTVPIMGRAIGPTRQGKVPEALQMYADFGRFGAPAARALGDMTCQDRRNADGNLLSFCLFSGGHAFPAEHLGLAWSRLAAAGRL